MSASERAEEEGEECLQFRGGLHTLFSSCLRTTNEVICAAAVHIVRSSKTQVFRSLSIMRHTALILSLGAVFTVAKGFLLPYRPILTSAILSASTECTEKISQLTEEAPHFTSPKTVQWVQYILNGYEKAYNKQLISRDSTPLEQAIALANLPLTVLSHDFLRNPAVPIFCFANKAGLESFQYTWDEFTVLPSKECVATPEEERTRNQFLESDPSTRAGYSGTRRRKDGTLFTIKDVKLWELFDENGKLVGQAATYS